MMQKTDNSDYGSRPCRCLRRLAAACGVATALSVASCASVSTDQARENATGWQGGDLADDFPRSRVVALDFVKTMSSLPELDPALTTLYTDTPVNRFGEILMSSLQGAGYDLRLGRDEGGNRLDYVIVEDFPDASTGANRYTFQINAGVLRLKRGYEVDVAGIRPTTAMLMHGGRVPAAAERVVMTNARPVAERAALVTPVPRRARVPLQPVKSPEELAVTSIERPISKPVSRPVVKQVSKPITKPVSRPVVKRPNSASTAKNRNMFDSDFSRYAVFLADYVDVDRRVMVFPNDSLFMGRENKKISREIVASFDSDNDVISVIGCSHGSTRIENGNEVLAIGRAERVREEFLLAGVDADLVLHEGCWAGTAHKSMPARGVLVTHKRRAG